MIKLPTGVGVLYHCCKPRQPSRYIYDRTQANYRCLPCRGGGASHLVGAGWPEIHATAPPGPWCEIMLVFLLKTVDVRAREHSRVERYCRISFRCRVVGARHAVWLWKGQRLPRRRAVGSAGHCPEELHAQASSGGRLK